MSTDTAVLMSVYAGDAADHFRVAVDSVLAQTKAEFQLLLWVDGPVGPEIDRVLQSISDTRVTVLRSARRCGLAHALNALIAEALRRPSVEFLARMDADDISLPRRLERQLSYLRQHRHIDVLGAWCDEIDHEGRFVWRKELPVEDAELKAGMLVRCPMIHPTVVFRRRVFESGVRYRTDTHLTEDMFLWVDLATRGFVFANVPEALLQFRLGRDFYRRRRGLRKAVSEFRAKQYIADQLGRRAVVGAAVGGAAFLVRILPGPVLKQCYSLMRGRDARR